MSQWISHIEGKWKMSMLFPAFYCNKPNSRAVVVFLHALASWKKSFVHCDLMRDDWALLGCDLKIKISTHTSLVLENRDVSCSLTTWSFFFFFCSQSLSTGQKMSSWNLISLLPAWPRATAQWGIQYYVWTSVCFSCHSTLRGVSGGSWTTWGRSQVWHVWLRGDSETSLQTGWRGSDFRLRCECQVVSFAMEKALIIQLYWHQTSCYQPADKHTGAFSS